MKRTFRIVETYWKEIEVNARSEDKALMLAKEQARKASLGKEYVPGDEIDFARDVLPQDKPTDWERLDLIAEETSVCWYQDMQPWQRKDLSKEELYEYAEQMRLALDRIFDLSNEYSRGLYERD